MVKSPDAPRKVEMYESTNGSWYPSHAEMVRPHLISAIRKGDNFVVMALNGANLPSQASPDWARAAPYLGMTRQINLT